MLFFDEIQNVGNWEKFITGSTNKVVKIFGNRF
jgi:predicted AAA+ superfamily ATPase